MKSVISHPHPSARRAGRCLVGVALCVVVLLALMAGAMWWLASPEQRQALDDFVLRGEEFLQGLRQQASERVAEELTPEQQERIRQELANLPERVRGVVDQMAYDRLGPRGAYSAAFAELEKAGGVDPATLTEPAALAGRLAQVERVEEVRALTEELHQADRRLLLLYRQVLELLEQEQGRWTLAPEGGAIRFERTFAGRRYEQLHEDIQAAQAEQAELLKQLEALAAAAEKGQ